jgi:hypothetical protein
MCECLDVTVMIMNTRYAPNWGYLILRKEKGKEVTKTTTKNAMVIFCDRSIMA